MSRYDDGKTIIVVEDNRGPVATVLGAVGGILKKATGYLFSVPGLIATAVAFNSTPAFVGASGLAKAAVVGIGTALGLSVGVGVGMVGGALFGAFAGAVVLGSGIAIATRKAEAITVGATIGMVAGGAVGTAVGGYQGTVKAYNWTRDVMVEKFDGTKAEGAFNNAAPKIELDRENFKATIKTPVAKNEAKLVM